MSTMKQKKTLHVVRRLKKYFENNGTASELASHLGYQSSETVRVWMRTKSVPHYMIERVEKYLEKKNVKPIK